MMSLSSPQFPPGTVHQPRRSGKDILVGVVCLLLLFVWLHQPSAVECRISSPTRDRTPVLGAGSRSHWSIREVPTFIILKECAGNQ